MDSFEDNGYRQAYAEFGKAEAPMFLLRVGRQELFFGDQRLIGHLNWTNTARSFDAARLTFQKSKVKVDFFASSVVNLKEGTANKSSGGNDLHGAYGSITKVVPNATIEPYVLWRLARGTKTEAGLGGKRIARSTAPLSESFLRTSITTSKPQERAR
jgi:hypothetical protein